MIWCMIYNHVDDSFFRFVLVIMEDLRDHVIMRKDLIEGKINLGAVKSVAKSSGTLHRKTHQKCLSPAQYDELIVAFT